MELTTFITAVTWFSLVFASVAGLLFIVMPLLLGQAQRAIRANPPLGPSWARQLWYGRPQIYRAIVAVALAAGALAFLLALV